MKFGNYKKLLFIFVVLAATVYPQNITDALRLGYSGIGSSARALGMGNSYIGLSDDASAGFFNPAGFGLLKKMEFSGGLDYSNFSDNATLNSNGSAIGQSSKNTASSTTLDRVSFAFPFPTVQGSLVFGLSYQNTKDLNGALSFNGYNKNSSFIQNLPSDLSWIMIPPALTGKRSVRVVDLGLDHDGAVRPVRMLLEGSVRDKQSGEGQGNGHGFDPAERAVVRIIRRHHQHETGYKGAHMVQESPGNQKE